MAAGTVSNILSEWLLVVLIVVTLIAENILHRIEHWIHERHHHLSPVVKVLYRELMILGIISFSFILYEVTSKPKGYVVLSFEFAHLFIFLLAVFYTFVILSTMYTSLRLSARWKKMERIDLVDYLYLKERYTRLKSRATRRSDAPWRYVLWWFPNFMKLRRYLDLHDLMAFHDIRFQFIYYRNLPEHFRFSSFLRKIKSATFIELVEAHWSLSIIFLGVLFLDLSRRYISGVDSRSPKEESGLDTVESAFIVGAAVVLAIFVQVLAIKIRKVYMELTRHPRIYYDGVQLTDVAEEIAVAKTRIAQGHRQSADNDGGNDADDEAPGKRGPSADTPENKLLHPKEPKPMTAIHGGPEVDGMSHISGPSEAGPASLDTFAENKGERSIPARDNQRKQMSDVTMFSDGQGTDMFDSDVPLKNRAQHRTSLDEQPPSEVDDLQETAQRHSLELPRGRPALRPVVPESDTADELHETAARHSLELPRATVRPPPQTFGASVAKAAVEAARKRTEGSVRGSLDGGSQAHTPGHNVGSPRKRSLLSSRRGSLDEDSRVSGGDYVRASIESRRRGEKRSIELAAVIPVDELEDRNPAAGRRGNKDVAINLGEGGGESVNQRAADGSIVGQGRGSMTGGGQFKQVKSRGIHNPSILRNLEHQQRAQNTEPHNYPKWLIKLVPRLGRVASPVEKLFWFGSHKFFLWCIEFVQYFSTVLLAAAVAGVSLLPLNEKTPTALDITALCLSVANLIWALFRIAGIIKKYIFILHNASLIPEIEAIEAIHDVREKRIVQDDGSDESGSETEHEEDDAARERRRRLGDFFRNQAESGNVPGIDGTEASSRVSTDSKTKRFRKLTVRRRNRSNLETIPEVPAHSPPELVSDA